MEKPKSIIRQLAGDHFNSVWEKTAKAIYTPEMQVLTASVVGNMPPDILENEFEQTCAKVYKVFKDEGCSNGTVLLVMYSMLLRQVQRLPLPVQLGIFGEEFLLNEDLLRAGIQDEEENQHA